MKKSNAILVFVILFLVTGCDRKQQSTDGIITVDIKASYPKKEMILQDFMDVEYIALETNNDFICQGLVLAIGKDILLFKNYINDGNIFVFDRKTGKGLKKINRKGQGGEEYTIIQRIVLDEANGEMFVDDHYERKIVVYDLEGNFKRLLKQNDAIYFSQMLNFDHENLICNNDWVMDRQPFAVISKQNGIVTNEISIPFEEKKSIMLSVRDEANDVTYGVSARTYNPIIPNFGNWLLVEFSSDTIYSYSSNHTMKPFIVRTPSIQSMNPEVFLFMNTISERYYMMEVVRKEFDWAKSVGFPATDLVYDKLEKKIFEYAVYNDDFSEKTHVNMKSTPINDEIAVWQLLEAEKLVESYNKGELKDGKLKEIAAKLSEEDNPVIMLIKHKK
jgi:hypothetical protein